MITVDVLQPGDLHEARLEIDAERALLQDALDIEREERLSADVALSERLDIIEGNPGGGTDYDDAELRAVVSTVDAKVTYVDDKVNALDTKVATTDSRLTLVDSKVTKADAGIITLDSRVTAVDNKANGLVSRVNNVESRVGALEARPPGGTTVVKGSGYYLDSYTGTDDEKLTAAIAAQRGSGGTTNMAPIILPSRRMNFNQTRQIYSGLKVIGEHVSGQKNAELSGGDFVGPEIVLGGSIGQNERSWWVGTGSMYDVYMADFSVQGSQGSYRQQFVDQATGTLYACEFDSLTFNFMDGVFGNRNRKCLFTQVGLTGTWTINNIWGPAVHVGGADNQLWKSGFVNMGPSLSPAQTGGLGSYQLIFSSLSKSKVGEIFMSSMNGYRGVLQTGASSYISYFGGVYEGYKPNGTTSAGHTLTAPGTLFKQDGGTSSFFGTEFGQAMGNPDVSEKGYIQLNAGEMHLDGCNFYGENLGSVAAVEQKGGRLTASGVHRVQNAAWTNRPKVLKTGGEFFAPDGSMTA